MRGLPSEHVGQGGIAQDRHAGGRQVSVAAVAHSPSPRLSAYLGLERQAEDTDGAPSRDLLDRLDAAWKGLTAYEVAWLRARRPGQTTSPFEDAARAKKVASILAVVPTGETTEQNRIIAEFLTGLSVPERAIFAKAAKANAPSAETWQQVIDAVRAWKPIGEI